MELKNGQNIMIHLETKALQGGEEANFIFDLKGQLVKMGDTLYIRYIEETPEEEIPVTIKIEPDEKVQIMRGSKLHSRLKFKYQERIPMSYRTPYGLFTLESFTRHMHFSLKDQPLSGSLNLQYDLFAGENVMGSYEMLLHFQG